MNAHQSLSDTGQAALSLARGGWPVFPCEHRHDLPGHKRCKTPLTHHGLKDASTDLIQVETWWRQWPEALIGVPTGSRIGAWVLDLDIDVGKGLDGPAALACLEAEHGLLPITVEAQTPRGGRHLLFTWDPERPITNSSGSLPNGIDVRGEGGYFIVPPSKRADGASYRWENPLGLFQHVAAPEWLCELILTRKDRSERTAHTSEKGTLGGASFFKEVNRRALTCLDVWVPVLFPGARFQPGTGAFRVSSRNLGQRLEEDLSFHSEGILDFGEERSLTAIDTVMKWGGAPDAVEAALWLCRQMGADPGTLGFRGATQCQAGDREASAGQGVATGDFYGYMPQHSYIFAPSGEMWPASSVNARLPPVPLMNEAGTPVLDEKGKPKSISASAWIDQNRPVEQVTWSPGHPAVIRGRLISEGGWIDRPGCSVFNLYRPPALVPKAGNASPWVEHITRVYPDEAGHLIKWLAHRVQNPAEKINHALVLGGAQGVGKDTMLEPVKRAIGPWNFSEVSPQHMLGRFNGFLKSVILRVSEARDLGDVDRFAFYDHMKMYTAAPPDVLRVDEKHVREHSVPNVCGVVITSNHKSDGIYLPADDRRHFVAWSHLSKTDFDEDYWRGLYRWFDNDGAAIVAHHLRELDLSGFNAKSPPPKTAAFWDIVNASRVPEDAELADLMDDLGWPETVTLAQLVARARVDFGEWLKDRKNSRRVPHRLEEVGYTAVRNPDASDGLWRVSGRRQAIYAKATLSFHKRLQAAGSHGGRGDLG